jgi:poly-gamma-glutamate synthase PgsB/CapB
VSLPSAIALLVLVVIGLGIVEYAVHVRNLEAIPVRIHVNGTRGKSSLVRLIAAALRAHGVRVLAKTTGSLPRVIGDDASEVPVYRPGRVNVIEQLRIIAIAARGGAEAIVIECMALQPPLQSLCELKMLRSTHGVISNVGPDHLDVMGPSVRDVALALAGTTPVAGSLFTAEREWLPILEGAARDRGTELNCTTPQDIAAVSDEEMERFRYIEHRENVALALAVASALDVPRDVALEGMVRAAPDAGALREFPIDFFGRRLVFVNGFAANDPVATERAWRLTLERHPRATTRVLVINCRLDRPDRSRQLGEALVDWPRADRYLLIGTGTYALARTAVRTGLPGSSLVPLEGKSATEVFEEILRVCDSAAVVMGAGNIAGVGLDLVSWFQNRTVPIDGGEADAA